MYAHTILFDTFDQFFYPLLNICILVSQKMGRCSVLEKYALKFHKNTSHFKIIFQTWKKIKQGKNKVKK